MNVSGRRSCLHTVEGPFNHEYLRPTNACLSTQARCNTDVILMYRFPIIAETHSEMCLSGAACYMHENAELLQKRVYQSQHNVAAYMAMYMSKSNPIARTKVNGFIEAQTMLRRKLRTEQGLSTPQIIEGAVRRLMTDLHGNGVTQMAVETSNLLTSRNDNDITAAESIKSNILVNLSTKSLFAAESTANSDDIAVRLTQDNRELGRGPCQIETPTFPYFYGYRSHHSILLYLTPYEFASEYTWMKVKVPTSTRLDKMEHSHVKRLNRQPPRASDEEMEPGRDYAIRDECGVTNGRAWFALHPNSQNWMRHDFVIVRRMSPVIPVMSNEIVTKQTDKEELSRRMLIVFSPWSFPESDDIPSLCELQTSETWLATWKAYLDRGVHSNFMKRIITNYCNVHNQRIENDMDDGEDAPDRHIIAPLQGIHLDDALLTDKKRFENIGTDEHVRIEMNEAFDFVRNYWGEASSNVSIESLQVPDRISSFVDEKKVTL